MASAKRQIKESVVSFLRDREGQAVTVADISEGLDLSRQQVFNAMTYITRELQSLVVKMASGVYRYGADGMRVETRFELVTDRDGKPIVKDREGRLFLLTPVKLP